MGHFMHSRDRKSRFDRTDRRWLKTGSQLQDLANEWSKRDDIIAFVGEGAANGSAGAAFVPDLAEMEVNVTAAFGEGSDPEFLGDLRKRDIQFDHPQAVGAVLHEAMHAKHSTWDLRKCAMTVKDRFEHALITDFEETRIEARGITAFPENRSFLRACALKLVLGDIKADDEFADRGHQSMSKLALLSLARIDAGVLDPVDVAPIHAAAVKLWGEELLATLRGIWVRAQAHSRDTEWEPLHKLALEWVKALEDAGHSPKDESKTPEWLKELLQAMAGAPGEGEPGDEDGPGAPGGILGEMADDAETRARDEGSDQAVSEAAQAAAEAAAAAAAEMNSHEKVATDVFGRGTGPGPARTSSRLQGKRAPVGPERAAAVKLGKDLERARYRDRVVEEKNSMLPPGRLRMRAAMSSDIQRERGMSVTAEPWKARRRYHVEDPELKVGVMVDISGSMSRAMAPMATTAWVLSEAVRRIQGKAAMVYYGNDVFPVLKPGQHLDEIHTYSAPDMTEKFDRGFKALNGQMNLLGSNGARLLVVVSDLYHTDSEIKAAKKWFDRCRRDGVAVVVVAPDDRQRERCAQVLGRNGVALTLSTEPGKTAAAIGAAAVAELTRASR